MKNTINPLPTGVKVSLKNNRIEVQMPGDENRSETFKKLMLLCNTPV